MANSNQETLCDSEPWGDDEEFDMLTSQMIQAEEMNYMRARAPSDGNGTTGLSPSEVRNNFNLRRDQLLDSAELLESQFQNGFMSNDQSDFQRLNAKYDALNAEMLEMKLKLQVTEGEKNTIRRRMEKLQKTHKEDTYNNITKTQETKQKYEKEVKELKQMVESLRTEMRKKTAEHLSALSKAKFGSSGQKPVPVPRNAPPKGPQTKNASRPQSNPNLSASTQEWTQSHTLPPSPALTPPPVTPPLAPLVVAQKSVTCDESQIRLELQDEMVFSKDRTSIDISKLESIISFGQAQTRRKIFNLLQSIIRSDYLDAKPLLSKVANSTPTEIMAKFVPGPRFKVCFPQHTDSIYLRGVEVQRQKEMEANGEYVPIKYPIIPSDSQKETFVDLDRLLIEIEQHLVHGGVWATLLQLKKALKDFLKELGSDKRFKLFEIQNLSFLWYLLAWAQQLWKLIVYEEELEAIVAEHGEEAWISELKEWSGLILKVDWRDFYSPEIEVIVRQFTLSILESIVTLGYFEECQKRYEILYCIIKDTLLKNHLRTESTIRQCLVIVTWTIADKHILNYLCLENKNPNCLARLIGEVVLKYLRENDDKKASVRILAQYLTFLENLMVKQPSYLYISKIARPDVNIVREKLAKRLYVSLEDVDRQNFSLGGSSDEDGEEGKENEIGGPQPMDEDEDFASTQFADPDKYREPEGSRDRAKKFNNVKEVKSWIDPKEWEVEVAAGKDVPCQCRKILTGSAFIMLYSMTKFWCEALIEHEEETVESERVDELMLNLQKEKLGSDAELVKKLAGKRDSLQAFIRGFLEDKNKAKKSEDNAQLDDDITTEWSWAEMLIYHRNKNKKGNVDCEPEWVEEKRRSENMMDYLLRRGAMLIGYFNLKSKCLAIAIGSEAFSSFGFLEVFFKFYEQDNEYLTLTDKKLVLSIGKDLDPDEEETHETVEYGGSWDIDDDDGAEDLWYLKFDMEKILEGLEDEPKKEGFDQEWFDMAWEACRKERLGLE